VCARRDGGHYVAETFSPGFPSRAVPGSR